MAAGFFDEEDELDKYYKRQTEKIEKKIEKTKKKLKYDKLSASNNQYDNLKNGGRKNKRKLTPKDQKFENIVKKVLKEKDKE